MMSKYIEPSETGLFDKGGRLEELQANSKAEALFRPTRHARSPAELLGFFHRKIDLHSQLPDLRLQFRARARETLGGLLRRVLVEHPGDAVGEHFFPIRDWRRRDAVFARDLAQPRPAA